MVNSSKSFSWLDWAREYKKVKYKGTLQITHTLFLNGKTIKQIAKERKLKEESVERQIIALIVKGLVHVADVVSEKKVSEVQKLSKENGKLSDIKETLGDKYSYFDIKASIAAIGVDAKKRSEQ